MGRVVLRGRASAVDLYEPAPDFPEQDRAALAHAMTIVVNDTDKAVGIIQTVAERHPTDTALQKLLERTRNLGEDDAYVLG